MQVFSESRADVTNHQRSFGISELIECSQSQIMFDNKLGIVLSAKFKMSMNTLKFKLFIVFIEMCMHMNKSSILWKCI